MFGKIVEVKILYYVILRPVSMSAQYTPLQNLAGNLGLRKLNEKVYIVSGLFVFCRTGAR